MKMNLAKNTIPVIFLFLISSGFVAYGQKISKKNIIQISNGAKDVIDQFNTYSDVLGDITETVEDRQDFFIPQATALFTDNKAQVYNDLEPKKETGETLPIDRYAANIILWYPNGLKSTLELNTLKYGEVQQVGETKFFVNVDVVKYISGAYMGHTMNRSTMKLEFRIAFELKNSVFINFKIAGINYIGEVDALPDPAGKIVGKTQVVQGEQYVKYMVAPITNADEYVWSFPKNIEGESDSNIVYVSFDRFAESSLITVRGKNKTGEGKASSFTILVNKLPEPANAIEGKEVVYRGEKNIVYKVGEIEHAEKYQWIFPNGFVGESLSNEIKVNAQENATTGEISVRGINEFGMGEEAVLQIRAIEKPKPVFIMANLAIPQTNINLSGQKASQFQTSSNYSCNSKLKLGYGITAGYIFNPRSRFQFGLGLGFMIQQYGASLGLSSFNDTIKGLTDADNDTYDRTISGKDISETLVISTNQIPIFFRMKYDLGLKTDINIDLGIKYTLITGGSSSCKTTVTTQGYYPDYNVTIYNSEQYGFINDWEIANEVDIMDEFSESAINAVAGVSFNYAITKAVIFELGIVYERGISNLKNNTGAYQMISGVSEFSYNSYAENFSDGTISALGIWLGFGIEL